MHCGKDSPAFQVAAAAVLGNAAGNRAIQCLQPDTELHIVLVVQAAVLLLMRIALQLPIALMRETCVTAPNAPTCTKKKKHQVGTEPVRINLESNLPMPNGRETKDMKG
jgi:hypothetical protein